LGVEVKLGVVHAISGKTETRLSPTLKTTLICFGIKYGAGKIIDEILL
jgi:hypothetical protein